MPLADFTGDLTQRREDAKDAKKNSAVGFLKKNILCALCAFAPLR
jgi:hypothetical protein